MHDVDQPGRPFKVELAANWRAQPPVVMDIGPVLHPDDVVAGKMSALYTRAGPRDFLDVDAAITSGRYTREQLCELAEQADAGFDPTEDIQTLRARFAAWRAALPES
ncbi:MAG TPA: nucleotidyl transferase AbiEii/AbiGii toxin family protein [Kineosporiaceae bacterium]|nr:nucleotidyl transferase AbiEii/AbiGii toxin family protein [Kineosporiaceae bacterium]